MLTILLLAVSVVLLGLTHVTEELGEGAAWVAIVLAVVAAVVSVARKDRRVG